MNYDLDYVENNLIAYIGNKRRLLPLILKAIEKTGLIEPTDQSQINSGPGKGENLKFLDLFAGTGVVSRLAKSLGFEVAANDWEYYSYIMNKAFLALDSGFLKQSFKKLGGIEAVIKKLNREKKLSRQEQYISKFYCPQNDSHPDLENERMFYTHYNGVKIDTMRAKIQDWFNQGLITTDENDLLLSLLLYESSTRSNTSGVFKAFHKGFGGTNGDALVRILKKVELNVPHLISGKKARVFQEDAVQLSADLAAEYFDIVYLDPPYNQHQYGSNYHLLNTIALNDKPAVNKNFYINGKKSNKSAIRKDWIKTRSNFCYKNNAEDDFRKLVANLNAHYILISYSTDGIIPFNTLLEILSSKGKISIILSEYTKYRGGKQALTTQVKNIEFILMVNTACQGNPEDIIRIQKTLLTCKIGLLMKKTVNPLKAETIGFKYMNKIDIEKYKVEKVLQKIYNQNSIEFYIDKNKIHNHDKTLADISHLPFKDLNQVYNELQFITNLTKEEEIYLVLKEIKKLWQQGNKNEVYQQFTVIPYLLSKFNNKKAYLPALKTIFSIFNTLLETKEFWQEIQLLDDKYFKKLEKITLLKLNYEPQLNGQSSIDLKRQIGLLYDRLLAELEQQAPKVLKMKKNRKIMI